MLFPGSTASFARQMARIPAELLSLPAIGFLAGRWQSRRFRTIFRHRETISAGILRCLLELPDEALEPSLLSIVEREEWDPFRAVEAIQHLYGVWKRERPRQPFRFRGLSSCEDLYRVLIRIYAQHRQRQNKGA